MYRKFYGLKDKPFQLIPNPQFLYLSEKHQNALTYLEYGLSEGSGFILLTGDIGSGKTTIVRHILNRIDHDIDVGMISNTNIDSGELISLVLHEFGVDSVFENKAKGLEAIFQFLIDKYAQGRRVLLVIDEAQNLSIQSLEEVRMLSNLQTDEQMLVQIMLVGQPELRRKLQLPELSQLSQRIAVYYHLGALERDDLPQYIAFRLDKVGGSLDIFDPATFDLIFEASGGIPRIINLLCDTALVYGYAESLKTISVEVMAQVIRDKDGFGLNSTAPAVEYAGGTPLSGSTDVLGQRLLTLETTVAGIQQQLGQTYDRMITELTGLLRQERDKNDKLLFEFALMKAKFGAYASHGDESFMTSASGSPSAEAPQSRTESTPAAGAKDDSGWFWGTKKSTTDVFSRIASANISMIDLHCHILPDIDDGPANFDESLAMTRIAAADGIAAIVATPHLKDTLYNPVEINRRVSWLNHLMRKENIQMMIMTGGDVSLMFSPEQVKGFTLNDTDYILLDFPHTHLPKNTGDILSDYVAKGYRPIISHPERNPTVFANQSVLPELLRSNKQCYVQITAGSLLGQFGEESKSCAQHLLRAGLVDVIATGAHDTAARKPELSAGVKAAAEIVGAEAAQRMVFGTPAKIIAGLDL